MIFAVIPAGGRSGRMGRPKLALPLGGQTVLQWVIQALAQTGVDKTLVVIGPNVPELQNLAESAGAQTCLLSEPTLDMRATVLAGLDWLECRYHPVSEDAWLLIPGDHPTLDARVVQQLIEARLRHPTSSIILPSFRGQRGHPALIDWKHRAGMAAMPAGQGLNSYLRQHSQETLEVSVDSPEVLADLDTPEDYQQLLARWAKRSRF
jgi:molybdenum cofactor cytidylyltransferase